MRKRYTSQILESVSAAICGLLLVACAPAVNVRTDAAPNVDMGKYHTYNFFSKMGIEDEGYSNLLGEHFRDAIGTQMNSRGYQASATPELQLNVSVATDDKIRVNTYQDPYLYGGYYGGFRGPVWGSPMYYGGGTQTTVTQYTQAQVYIDFIDAGQHKMVWQGVATFTLTEKMQQQVRDAISSTVAEVFSNYPVSVRP